MGGRAGSRGGNGKETETGGKGDAGRGLGEGCYKERTIISACN